MSLSAKIREQLISSFRVELAEHVQTMNDGLLSVEQERVEATEHQETLENVFRAAHSLKGAARAVGVTMVEQLAHTLESVLDALQHQRIEPTPEMFTACYTAIDAIELTQAAYEAGETTPPLSALQAVAGLEPFASRQADKPGAQKPKPERPRLSKGEPDLDAALSQTVSALMRQVQEEKSQQQVGESSRTVPVLPPLDSPLVAEQTTTAGPPSTTASLAATAPGQAQVSLNDSVPSNHDGPSNSGMLPGRDGSKPSAVSANGDETIRVPVSKLDALMAQLSELLVSKIRIEQGLNQVRQFQGLLGEWQKDWLEMRSVYNRLVRQQQHGVLSDYRMKSVDAMRSDLFGLTQDRAKSLAHKGNANSGFQGRSVHELRELSKDVEQLLGYVADGQDQLYRMGVLVNDLSRQYASDTMHMSLVIGELEQEIKRVRMLPLSTITGTFGRMVRDLAHLSNKEVVLEIVGGETELDKQVLEQIKDPLIHLLRNAVDHGIEPPEVRKAMGKPPTGTITLRAEQAGKDVVLSISDDGRGLDFDAIRQVVGRKRGVDAQALSEAELKEAIFTAGISTSPIITDISGRGVGLDVVRRNIETLHGVIDLESEPGWGTTFKLTLQLALTSSRGLMVRAGGELLAIPIKNVEWIARYHPEEIVSLEGQDTVRYNNRPLTLVRLSDVLELPDVESQHDQDSVLVVILAGAERRMAFAVDDLVDEQEVVMKGLGQQLARVGGIAGATVQGNGQVVLILNVADLIKMAMKEKRRSVLDMLNATATSVAERTQRRILVVDDSITTRTLEKNILEAAGYTVQLATDGREALNVMATGGIPDLIVSDVAMPRMNGFDLTRQVKEDSQTTNVPVILVTSLDSVEDKTQGIEAGADAYIVKSSFDQQNLLETIEQLI
ncbi:MAG: hybrid sensor histidine kinase/response regulator [Anaerolineae bacterium]|nr:hybrid sensor histidine kinase/response regulator [Anaerolineae bacterium]